MVINAKFSSLCPVCSERIEVGSKVEWNKGEKAIHAVCKPVDPAEVEHLEKTFPSILNEKAFKQWISSAQVDSMIRTYNLKASSRYTVEGANRKFYVGNAGDYALQIYISPINNAGSITITNTKLVQDEKNQAKNEQLEALEKELAECEEMVIQLANETYETFPNKDVYNKANLERIEQIKNALMGV